jgi:hypothetical protein
LKNCVAIILLLLLTVTCFSQEEAGIKPVAVIKGRYINFTVDNLGNIFLLDKDNQLKKLSPAGDSIAVFNDVRRFGKVYSIDATNPLKVLLYYKDFATVVVLDRLLNARTTIDLRKLNILQVKAICLSYDNGIWVYDELEAKIKKIADDGTVVTQTGDLRQQLEEAPSPLTVVDDNRLLYLYDSTKGLLVFDYFGTLKNNIPFKGWQDFQVVGNYVVGRKGDLLERYQLSSLSLQERSLPVVLKDAVKVRIAIDRLYCLRNGYLYIYAL